MKKKQITFNIQNAESKFEDEEGAKNRRVQHE